MSEFWLRVGLVAGALAVAWAASWWLRRGAKRPMRQVGEVKLSAGAHFFSSTDCGTCRSARKRLAKAVGSAGFTEHVWEDDPGVFAEIGVDAVPATLIVEVDGLARLYPGDVEKALEAL